MKRLNHKELDNRIRSFMDRKLAEFPDLRDDTQIFKDVSVQAAREHDEILRGTPRFGFRWHMPRVA